MITDIHVAEDYAYVEADNRIYYYGYEETINTEWCFTVHEDGEKVLTMPTSLLERYIDIDGDLDVSSYLIAGMHCYTKLKQLEFLEITASYHQDDKAAQKAMQILQTINKTYHRCGKWNGMVISDQHKEFDYCICDLGL